MVMMLKVSGKSKCVVTFNGINFIACNVINCDDKKDDRSVLIKVKRNLLASCKDSK